VKIKLRCPQCAYPGAAVQYWKPNFEGWHGVYLYCDCLECDHEWGLALVIVDPPGPSVPVSPSRDSQ